jgi:predicted DNA-binding transcriptional regulator YafY
MPANKYALLRYRIIDRCLTNPARPFPSKEDLRLACEEALYGSDGEHISISTIEKDLWAMRNESDLGYHAPIAYHRDERGYHYTEEGYSINDIQLNDDDLDAIRFAANTLLQFRELPIFQQFDQALGKIADRLTVSPTMDTRDMDAFIQFESAPHAAGSEHLAPLLSAIRERAEIAFDYQKFSDSSGQSTRHSLHPYLLKEYRNRWYLIGWEPAKNHIRTYGCDRMSDLLVHEEVRFELRSDFNPEHHFKHALGITVLGERQPVRVEFLCDDVLAKYLGSQPLHPSQSIRHTSTGIHVTLEVMPTFELQQWLLAHANELTLLSPSSIRTSIVSQLQRALDRQTQG